MQRLALLFCLLLLADRTLAQAGVEVTEASILELQAALEAGRVNSVQLVDSYLRRIEAYDRQGPRLNSIVRINPAAREIAAALDAERARGGARSPLHGIPLVVKDNYNTIDMPTTGGSVALAGFMPGADATTVERLKAAGAIILAKTNLHEYAYGVTTIGSLAGQTRNPYDPRRVPGGSSGGTGAAVAASLAAAGMGSDTCGSIRIPSAFNNLVGLRPSKGMTSIHGVMPLSHTQDVTGPLARSSEDLALVLDVVAGYDARDAATAIMDGRVPGFHAGLESVPLAGLRVGRLGAMFDSAEAGVARTIDAALTRLEAAGVEVVEVELPGMTSLVSGSGLIGHEFARDLDEYLAGFGASPVADLAAIVDAGLYHVAVQGVLQRSDAGEFDPAAYAEALAGRDRLRQAIEGLLEEQRLDALVYPPIGSLPVFIGEAQPGNNCSLSANSGLPAIALPAGFTGDGLPVGMELLGPFLADVRLLAIAHRVENLLEGRLPPFSSPVLVDGAAPAPQAAGVAFAAGGISLSGNFTYTPASGQLHFDLDATASAPDSLYAVVLMIDQAPLGDLDDPAQHNLLGPLDVSAAGEIAASPALRSAIQEGRVYLRFFGAGLAPSGSPVPVDFLARP